MFTLKDVEKIAKLSALDLNPEEKKMYAHQFSDLLHYFEILNRVDCSEETTTQQSKILEKNNPFRVDIRHDSEVSPSQFSPYTEKDFFKVPKVLA